MKKLLEARVTATILSLLLLIIFSGINVYHAKDSIMLHLSNIFSDNDKSLKENILAFENIIDENIFMKDAFIELYGSMQYVQDKNEISNFSIVKDEMGKMHYSYFANKKNDVNEIAQIAVDFGNDINNTGANFVYLMPPDKEVLGATTFSYGIPYPFRNEEADDFLNVLKKNNIKFLDFRVNLLDSGIKDSDLFYDTDHHWKTETAFWAFTQLVEYINYNFEQEIDPDGFYRDINNYNQIEYENSYLGSLGRKVGVSYGGIDDFTLIYPKFNTDYDFYGQNEIMDYSMHGPFKDSLLSFDAFTSEYDLMNPKFDKYMSYLGGNLGLVHIDNKLVKDGPKVLFIKDSLMVPVAAFLTTVCSDVDLIDPRHYNGDIRQYAIENDYDYVFMSFSPPNLSSDFFDTLK